MKKVAVLCAVILFFFACKSNDKAQSPKTSSPKEKEAVSSTEIEDTLNLDPNFEAFYETIAPKKQKFVVKGNKANSLKCKNGTKLEIPANTFCYKDGTPVKGLVGIEVKECLTLGDIIGENLSTRSNGKILETGGMIHISARSKGRDLKVRSGKEFEILFPAKKRKEGMETFYGKRKSNGEMNWKLASEELVKEVIPIVVETQVPDSNENKEYSNQPRSNNYWRVTSRTSAFQDDKISWDLVNSETNAIEYFERNFISTKEMSIDFSNNDLVSEFNFLLDSKGKIVDIKCEKPTQSNYDNQFIEFLESMPPLKIDATMSKYKKRRLSLSFRYGIDWNNVGIAIAAHHDPELEEKRKEFETKKLDKVDKNQLNYYAMTSTKLGWINCDRFYNSKAQKIDYYVKTDEPENTRMYLVFKSISAVMVGTIIKGMVVFKNIPINLPVRIVGLKCNGSKPKMGISETKTSRSAGRISKYKEFNLTELNKQMSL